MIKIVKIFAGRIFYLFRRAINSCISSYQLSLFSKKGRNCYINGPGYFSYSNIELGDRVYIGKDCTLMASESKIIIEDNVVFGPHIFVIGGNHRFDIVGTPIRDIKEKRPQDDADVIIGAESWIGANSMILKGVHIGRGCVVGGGSVVTKDIPPYTIYTNKSSRPRFTGQQIKEHESILYSNMND